MASSSTTLARKRKGNATAEKVEQNTTKKKRYSDKAMPKKTREALVTSLNSLEPRLHADEVCNNIESRDMAFQVHLYSSIHMPKCCPGACFTDIISMQWRYTSDD